MLNPPALRTALGHAPRQPQIGLAFRAIHLRHFPSFAATRPLFCSPGGPTGSRFIATDGPHALYLATDADTAQREFNGWFYRMARGGPGRALVRGGSLRPDPCVTIGIHVRLSHLLNLNSRLTRRLLGIRTVAEILRPWLGVPNAPTQVLGTEVHACGRYEGILYPSAQNAGHVCLVLFRDRLLPTSRVHFHDTPTSITDQFPLA